VLENGVRNTHKQKSVFKRINLENFEKILSRRTFKVETGWLLLGIGVSLYTIVFSYFTIMKYCGFRTYAWDLGIFNQSFWTTLFNGRFFYSTVELLVNPSGSFFGTHFSPILFFVLPFYAIYPTPQTLLMIQSFILALGAIPLYKLSMHVVKYRVFSLPIASIYLLYPPLQGINWFDFHVQSFLPLFFFSTMYFLEKRNWRFFLLFNVLALMCEEHAAMVVFFIGILAILQNRKQTKSALRIGGFKDKALLILIATVVLPVLWYVLSLWVRDTFFPVNPVFLSTFKASSNWSVLGVSDPIMIPLHVILHPANAILALYYDFLVKVSYVGILFAPLAFLPFLKARYLLPAAPWFIYSLFSNYQPYYTIFFQYPAYVIAFIFVAAVYAVGNAQILPLRALRKPLMAIVAFGLLASAISSPLSPIVATVSNSSLTPVTQHELLIHRISAYVPSDSSIMTSNNLFVVFSSRINAYVIPTIAPLWVGRSSDCINFINETLGKVDYVLLDIKTDQFASSVVFQLMQNNPDFGAYVSGDGVVLFKKSFRGNTMILAPYIVRYDYTDLALYSGEVTYDSSSASGMVLHFNGAQGNSPMFWYGPRSLLPPGKYNVTLRLKINGTGEVFTLSICSNNGRDILTSKTYSDRLSAEKIKWIPQSFQICLEKPLLDFEVRATNVSSTADIYLDYIELAQIDNIAS